MWGPDAPHVPPERAARDFGIAVAIFVTLGVIIKLSVPARPAAPREYPYSGLVTELGGLEENKVSWQQYFHLFMRVHEQRAGQSRNYIG